MLCPCKLNSCNRSITLVGDVDSKGDCTCVEERGMCAISAQSPQFCYEPKTFKK